MPLKQLRNFYNFISSFIYNKFYKLKSANNLSYQL
jgi:hypothetical protein